MNDFTKEELEILQWEINTAIIKIEMCGGHCEKHIKLQEKITNIIYNYCDHKNVVPRWDPSTQCADCGEIV